MSTIENRCVKCGKKTPATAAFCPHCKVCLLIDVVVDRAVDEARSIYLIAKEIDELGADAPTFNESKSALELAPGLVAADCTRGTAQAIAGVLRKHKIASLAVPVRRPRRPITSRGGPFAFVGPWLVRTEKVIKGLPPNAKIIIVAVFTLAGLALMLSPTGDLEQTGAPKPQSVAGSAGLSSRELIFTALSSSVKLRCSGSTGAGFFVGPEQLVTNASILGTGKSPIEIVFPDDRRLAGRVERINRWLDLAVVEVSGAAAIPLELGDATELEQGSTVTAIGNPGGLDFTVTQGVVSRPARFLMGMTYLQIDATMKAGSGGGPILDRRGRVVGIASATLAGSSSPGLAIPVNYLWSGTHPLLERERDNGERRRWEDIIFEATKQEARDLEEMRSSLGKPSLVSARFMPPETVRTVIVRFAPSSPPPEHVAFDLIDNGSRVCSTFGEITSWEPISETADLVARSRFHTWLSRHNLPGQFYSGTIHLHLYGCPGADAIRRSELVLTTGDPRANRVVFAPASQRNPVRYAE